MTVYDCIPSITPLCDYLMFVQCYLSYECFSIFSFVLGILHAFLITSGPEPLTPYISFCSGMSSHFVLSIRHQMECLHEGGTSPEKDTQVKIFQRLVWVGCENLQSGTSDNYTRFKSAKICIFIKQQSKPIITVGESSHSLLPTLARKNNFADVLTRMLQSSSGRKCPDDDWSIPVEMSAKLFFRARVSNR